MAGGKVMTGRIKAAGSGYKMAREYRQGRLGGEIKKIISEMLLRELKDPRLDGMISISDVEVTRDGSYATCYVTILDTTEGEEARAEREQEVLDGLKSAKGLMRKEIGKELKLRRTPDLIFKMDHSMDYGRHIDEILKGLDL